ncbi:MAG TPA: hypothetical protein VGC99_13785 [Candidatus Tectomicrobia bacterium]
MQYATYDKQVGAAAAWYGPPGQEYKAEPQPVVSMVAEDVTCPSAGHAFYADYRQSYRAEAAKDGWTWCVVWVNR